jgi:hypothetical protein
LPALQSADRKRKPEIKMKEDEKKLEGNTGREENGRKNEREKR